MLYHQHQHSLVISRRNANLSNVYNISHLVCSITRIAYSLYFTQCFIVGCFSKSIFQSCFNISTVFGVADVIVSKTGLFSLHMCYLHIMHIFIYTRLGRKTSFWIFFFFFAAEFHNF